MITLLGAILGFFGSAFPELLKLLQDKRDKAHELAILELQMRQAEQGHLNRLEEIGANADIAEAKAIYRTYNVGIKWVDALNGTVRPVLAYAFFLLYAWVKIAYLQSDMGWQVWTEEDGAIFAGIISFYFGSRAVGKAMGRVK